jgi:hypothetical protein
VCVCVCVCVRNYAMCVCVYVDLSHLTVDATFLHPSAHSYPDAERVVMFF